MGKVVEIPADMTARDLCQLLVYKSHCVDDNSWALVEHHPLLGLGKGQSPAGLKSCTHTHTNTHDQSFPHAPFAHAETNGVWFGWLKTRTSSPTQTHACLHACAHRQLRRTFSRSHVFKHECMHILYIICTHCATMSGDLIKSCTAPA